VTGGDRNLVDLLRPVRRLLARAERAQVQRVGRSLLSTLYGADVLVLHTTGRRSGTERATTLAYTHRGDDLVVVGGAGGQRRLPDWVANLRAEPAAAVTSGAERRDVRAVEVTGEERAAMWPDLLRTWPRIERYEQRAGRPAPVFRLESVTATG
jgi:deazaflavin-dependent oxidoreductase (nitroreductase family)